MDGIDIIAESQTESVLAALDRGDADDKVRDQVSAALLRALTTVRRELMDIKANLWKPDDLRRLIDERHDQRCRDCPAKQWVDERVRQQRIQQEQAVASKSGSPRPEGGLQWFMHLAGSSSFQFFVLLLFLIGAFIYLTTGKSGVDAARETVGTVISGGSR